MDEFFCIFILFGWFKINPIQARSCSINQSKLLYCKNQKSENPKSKLYFWTSEKPLKIRPFDTSRSTVPLFVAKISPFGLLMTDEDVQELCTLLVGWKCRNEKFEHQGRTGAPRRQPAGQRVFLQAWVQASLRGPLSLSSSNDFYDGFNGVKWWTELRNVNFFTQSKSFLKSFTPIKARQMQQV